MNAIIITGKKDSGKSTTIQEICKNIKPQKIWRISVNQENPENSSLIECQISDIYNNTFVILKNNLYILIIAGCPTENNINFTLVFEVCIKLELSISFVIAAKRTREVKNGFNTKIEIENFGFVTFEEWIERIENSNFMETTEWKNRIDKLTSIVLQKIN